MGRDERRWYATPVFSAGGVCVFRLDALGDELEEPYGASLNARPPTALARTVAISLLEALGSDKVPAALVAAGSVLR